MCCLVQPLDSPLVQPGAAPEAGMVHESAARCGREVPDDLADKRVGGGEVAVLVSYRRG